MNLRPWGYERGLGHFAEDIKVTEAVTATRDFKRREKKAKKKATAND